VIPKVVAPLTGLTVLVTRPAPQAATLCREIEARGGEAIAFPCIEIAPLEAAPPAEPIDLAVFVSVNAVEHGARLIPKSPTTRIAAIGRATAAALAAADRPASIVPTSGFDSETLLADPGLSLAAGARVVIVHGEGGRDLLQQSFLARGFVVETLDVYRRVRPSVDESSRSALEQRWAEDGIDVVTLTSVETLQNLLVLLTDRARSLLRDSALLVASRRIIDAAASEGLRGELILAPGADDASMLGALANWRARARAP
jgi:uroporphyrinogen-III synthase